MQFHPVTVNLHAVEEANSIAAPIYTPHLSSRREGILTPQYYVAVIFLDRYGEENALICPTGRGTSTDRSMQWLESDLKRENVYSEYQEKWRDMMEFYFDDRMTGGTHATRPDTPLKLTSFFKIWNHKRPTLRIMKTGSDFCDT